MPAGLRSLRPRLLQCAGALPPVSPQRPRLQRMVHTKRPPPLFRIPGNRPLMETRVHGCDLCKKACPRNGTKLRSAFPEAPLFELITRDFILPAHAEHDRRIL